MVLGDLIPVKLAEERPIKVLPLAFLYTTIAIFLALWIFPSHAAIVAVFLTTMAAFPLMLHMIYFEKTKEEKSNNYLKQMIDIFITLPTRKKKRSEKQDLLDFFIFMFIGLTVSVTAWYVLLPTDLVTNLFYLQLNTVKEINLALGNVVVQSYFIKILLNNLKVLLFTVLFSFIYGAGAIFILTWNASVVGVAIGHSIKSQIAYHTTSTGFTTFAGYSTAVSVSLLRYMIHGIPEILAYFVGGLAGGLISVAIIKHEWDSNKFQNTLYHSFGLIALAILILIIAGILEVSVSPFVGRLM